MICVGRRRRRRGRLRTWSRRRDENRSSRPPQACAPTFCRTRSPLVRSDGGDAKVSADEGGRRSDEAVRRFRAESGRRIERSGRVRAFSSWCALATLAGGISLAALDAHEARLQERAAAEEARQREQAGAIAERE